MTPNPVAPPPAALATPGLVRRAGRLAGPAALAAAVLAGGGAAPAAVPQGPALSPVAESALSTPPPLRIMPLGDSLTFGKGSSDESGYRADLGARLAAAGVAVDFVGSHHNGAGADDDHEGYPGWRIDQIARNVDDWIAADRPDIVLLDIGTNDVVQHFRPRTAPARMAALVDRILAAAPDARIVVAKLLVISGTGRARQVEAFNAALPGIVAAHADRVTLADMSRLTAYNTVDGTHPTDLGYRQMAFQWFEALRGVIPGGGAWAPTADPFPRPAVVLSRAGAETGDVRLVAHLEGLLTAVDVGRVPVELRYWRPGRSQWTTVATARTTARGAAVFRYRAGASGYYSAVIASGRAAGEHSTAVKVHVR